MQDNGVMGGSTCVGVKRHIDRLRVGGVWRNSLRVRIRIPEPAVRQTSSPPR